MKISIVMPTFNRRAHIGRAVASLLSQDYDNFEIVIKDGGESIEDVLPKDPRIVYRHSKDGGITDAVNQALEIATGDVLNWSNDDDLMAPGALKYVASRIGHAAWGYGLIRKRKWIFTKVCGERWSYKRLLESNIVPQPATFWTRWAMNQVGRLDPSNDLCSDYEYWLRLGEKFDPVFFDRVLAIYNIHPTQTTKVANGEQNVQARATAEKYLHKQNK